MEKWKEIDGTSGRYFVSDHGRVKGIKGYVLKTQKDEKGYERIRCTVNGEKTTLKVHRVVASAFIDNPDMKNQVNHKDGDKSNNCYTNLEWCTNEENMKHAISRGYYDHSRRKLIKLNQNLAQPIIATNIKTGEIKIFESISSAERALNTRHITAVLKGERTKAKGYTFERIG